MENFLEKLDRNLNSEKIRATIDLFLDEFKDENYIPIEDDSISVNDDNTLLFANSTVAKYKKDIIGNKLPESGYAISQKCLRTWGLMDYLDPEVNFEYSSYFTMIGVVFPGKDPRDILVKTIGFLTKAGYSENRIIIKTSSNSQSVNTCIPDTKEFQMSFDSEHESFYKWVYGVDSIYGEGITLSYLNDVDEVRDIGNIISVLDSDDNLIAWESGFGVETVLATLNNKDLFQVHPIWDTMDYDDNFDVRKFADCVVSIIALMNEGIEPGPKKQNYILKKFLSVLYYLNMKLGLDITSIVTTYCEKNGINLGTEIGEKVSSYVFQIQESKKKKFDRF